MTQCPDGIPIRRACFSSPPLLRFYRVFADAALRVCFPGRKTHCFLPEQRISLAYRFKGSMRSSRFSVSRDGLLGPSSLKALSESGTFSTSSAVNSRMYWSGRLIGYKSSRRSHFCCLLPNVSKQEWTGLTFPRKSIRTDGCTHDRALLERNTFVIVAWDTSAFPFFIYPKCQGLSIPAGQRVVRGTNRLSIFRCP